MTGGRGTVLLIMLVAVVALAAGETALAKGMKQIDRLQGGWVEQFTALARNGWIAAGLALLLAHLGLYMLALKSADLSYALPLTAASYPLAALLRDSIFTKMSVFRARWDAILITLGVAIVVLGEPGGPLLPAPAGSGSSIAGVRRARSRHDARRRRAWLPSGRADHRHASPGPSSSGVSRT